jgi:DNA-binding MarR family transcriptional regulator
MDEVQTVRGLAAKLNASKPATTRALDRLSELGLVRRKADPLDRRSILIHRTTAGAAFLVNIKSMWLNGAKAACQTTTPRQDETMG